MSDSLQAIENKIRKAVREGRYIITDHVLEEAKNDSLMIEDIVTVLLNGILLDVFEHDPRGVRYVVGAQILENNVEVVCRFRNDGTLLIVITVYIVY